MCLLLAYVCMCVERIVLTDASTMHLRFFHAEDFKLICGKNFKQGNKI